MKIHIHPDVRIHQHNVHYDFRGELWTLWKQDEFYPQLDFNHDKVSTSRKHVLRGIPPLVGCLEGKSEFVCHPSVVQVFNKIIEINNR